MIIPPYLKPGDYVGIISTARKITSDELKKSIHTLKEWGLRVKLGENIFSEYNQFSGTDIQRVNDLKYMLNDKSIKAILCAKGGYGTIRIIDQIQDSCVISSPKWIVGYSDVTVLHSYLNNLGIASAHATMPINFASNTKISLKKLNELLFGKANNIKYKSHKLNRFGEIEAEIVGGNLSIIYSLLGSPTDIDTNGKILFIEDVDEYLYHIDRMMINLKRNNKLYKLKGLIVGGMTDMNDNKIKFGRTAEEIVFDHVKEYDFPVCFGFPAGHLDNNLPIIFGKKSLLKITLKSVILQQNYI